MPHIRPYTAQDRAAAELALSAAQRMKVKPSARIARMRGQAFAHASGSAQPAAV